MCVCVYTADTVYLNLDELVFLSKVPQVCIPENFVINNASVFVTLSVNKKLNCVSQSWVLSFHLCPCCTSVHTAHRPSAGNAGLFLDKSNISNIKRKSYYTSNFRGIGFMRVFCFAHLFLLLL